MKNFTKRAVSSKQNMKKHYLDHAVNFYADYRSAKNKEWEALFGFWPTQGLSVSYRGKKKYTLVLATALKRWSWRNPTFLPGDEILCQLHDQVILVNMRTRQVGFLVKGHAPVAVYGDLKK